MFQRLHKKLQKLVTKSTQESPDKVQEVWYTTFNDKTNDTAKDMTMFGIEAGTEVLVIKDHTEWRSQNFKRWTTKLYNLFDKEEMTIDPTGISSWTVPLNGPTVGAYYGKAGYYAFHRDGYTLLCHRSFVTYVD